MRSLIPSTAWGLLWLAFSMAAFGTTLNVTSQPFNVDNGGGFTAYLDNNTGNTFEVFCIDYRNFVSVPESFTVNVDTLPNDADTRYGTTSAGSFSFYGPGLSALDRYILVAWLTTQFDQSNPTGDRDKSIQDAIWNLLDVDNVNHNDGSAVSTWVSNAEAWESGLSSQAKADFESQIRIFTSSDVSGTSTPNRYTTGNQEFITVTPEPMALLLVGTGLLAVGLLRRPKS